MSKPLFCPPYTPMVDVLSPVQSGRFAIEEFEITPSRAKLQSVIGTSHGGAYSQYWQEGQYIRLVDTSNRANGPIMSDTPMERISNIEFVREANGHILIAGLGIGMVLLAIAPLGKVERVTVVEVEQDIINMVLSQLKPHINNDDDWLTIFNQDILEFKPVPGVLYDTIYFDIWPDMCGDNYEEMKTLHRKSGRRLNRHNNPNAWMSSWRRDEARDLAKRGY